MGERKFLQRREARFFHNMGFYWWWCVVTGAQVARNQSNKCPAQKMTAWKQWKKYTDELIELEHTSVTYIGNLERWKNVWKEERKEGWGKMA